MLQSAISDKTWKIHHKPHEQARREWIATRPPVSRALDVGCGQGYMTSAIQATHIVGCDVNTTHLDVARRFFLDNDLDIPVMEGDIYDLPFSDKKFDAVYCLETLEHLEDPVPAAREIRRVCRGTLYVSVPAHGHMRSTPGHLQDFTSESLAELFGADATDVIMMEPFALLEVSCGSHT